MWESNFITPKVKQKWVLERELYKPWKNNLRYLEENDTLSYIKDLQRFVDIIKSRINRNIGFAPKYLVKADYLSVKYERMKLQKNKSHV